MYTDDFTYFYYQDGQIKRADRCSAIPEFVEDFCKISDAVYYVQKNGCCGMSQHIIQSDYHQLCLDVLKLAVEKYGEIFPQLFRGVRNSQYKDSDHKILFGTTDRQVAEFYGEVKIYTNIKGLRTYSIAESVTGSDSMDEEIIFFP